ncbi:MAG: phage tail protein [Bacteroidetes bacterium]|nr:phage tail protein [Bacteroidota bacterium]
MAFKGVFKFKGKEYTLLSFSHEMDRALDKRGAPAEQPKPGLITIQIEVADNNDLAAWAFIGYQTEEGEIVIYKRDSEATLRSLKFKDGYISYYLETFSNSDSQPSTFTISITPKEIQLSPGGIDLIADWA